MNRPRHNEPAAVALVTGGGRGIGRAIALGLADAGHQVAILARSANELEATRAELEARGARAAACVADVVDRAAVENAIRRVEDELGPIRTLVCNAGTGAALGPAWETDPDTWWRDVETNLRGTFIVCRTVVPGMVARAEGRILNVASYAAVRPAPYQTAYAAAKAAVVSFTEALAASLAPHGVKAFVITPGFVHTELTRQLAESPWFPELATREALDPDLVGRLAVFLASGRGDPLAGRFLHALDDLEELLRRLDEIERDELYVPRLRRLPGA
jgi:NAD(P)-dependent dehydrogenase (short-subunit alcohol dehydrogenase family)